MSAAAKRWRYLRRLVLFRQMDFEFAFWQMVYLMTAPHEVCFVLLNAKSGIRGINIKKEGYGKCRRIF
jgi:hypothetical protein